MALSLSIVAVALAILLGLYLFARYDDRVAGLVCVVLAGAVVWGWYVGKGERDTLERDMEAARERIAELEEVPAQRGFTAEARRRMVEALSEFAGPKAFVLANSSDLETTEYAREIANILKDAGWEVPPSFGMSYRPVRLPGHDGVPRGVVLGASSDVPERFVMIIFNAFREAGVEVVRGPHWPGTEHPISILVGPPLAP